MTRRGKITRIPIRLIEPWRTSSATGWRRYAAMMRAGDVFPPISRRNTSPGFVEPCLPSRVARPPSGPLWVHEIKHDGYRLMVRRDGARVRCFTRNGHDWADRFPAIVDAALRIKASSFLIDGEARDRPRRRDAGLPCATEQAPGT